MSEPVVLLLSDDLLFTSRITATARAHRFPMKVVRTVPALAEQLKQVTAWGCLIDLDLAGNSLTELMTTMPTGVRVVGYGSHVEAERLKVARQLGVHAMPRSQFVERLETQLVDWFRPDASESAL